MLDGLYRYRLGNIGCIDMAMKYWLCCCMDGQYRLGNVGWAVSI